MSCVIANIEGRIAVTDFLLTNPEASVYVSQSFPDFLIDNIEKTGEKDDLVETAKELQPNFFTHWELSGVFKEQVMALMINEECIACNACVAECHNDAISEGDPIYIIDPH